MLINSAEKDKNNKKSQLLKMSEMKNTNTCNINPSVIKNIIESDFNKGIERLNSMNLGNDSDLAYRLQQTIQQNKNPLLNLDTMWGYEVEGDYKISHKGLYQPFIVHRVVRPHDYDTTKTLCLDTNDISLLASTTKLGVSNISSLEKTIFDYKYSINVLKVLDFINILESNILNILRTSMILLQKYDIKYSLDISECIIQDPYQLMERLKLYGNCNTLGITGLSVDISTLQLIMLGNLNTIWLQGVKDLTVKVNGQVFNMSGIQKPSVLNVDNLNIMMDCNYSEDYLITATQLLDNINAKHINLTVKTDNNLLITKTGSILLSRFKGKNTSVFIEIDISTMDSVMSAKYERLIIDISNRYGNIQGIILSGGSVLTLDKCREKYRITYEFESGNEVLFNIAFNQPELLIINRCKVFNNLSHLLSKVDNNVKIMYIDSEDSMNFNFLS